MPGDAESGVKLDTERGVVGALVAARYVNQTLRASAQTILRSIKQSSNQANNQTTKQPNNQSTKQPNNQTTEQSINLSCWTNRDLKPQKMVIPKLDLKYQCIHPLQEKELTSLQHPNYPMGKWI